MTQYRTNNPLGSMAPRDLFDNAQNVDNWSNGEEPFYEDRFGVMRRSFSGMNFEFEAAQTGRNAAFDAQMAALGYVSKGAYAAGIVLETYSEYVAVPGVVSGGTPAFYRPGPNAELPLTLEGDWAIDGPLLLQMDSDDVLRQELAGVLGSTMVGRSVIAFASLDELLSDTSLNYANVSVGVSVKGGDDWYSVAPQGATDFSEVTAGGVALYAAKISVWTRDRIASMRNPQGSVMLSDGLRSGTFECVTIADLSQKEQDALVLDGARQQGVYIPSLADSSKVWRRVYSGPVMAEWFGAKPWASGDTHDSTAAFQAASDFASSWARELHPNHGGYGGGEWRWRGLHRITAAIEIPFRQTFGSFGQTFSGVSAVCNPENFQGANTGTGSINHAVFYDATSGAAFQCQEAAVPCDFTVYGSGPTTLGLNIRDPQLAAWPETSAFVYGKYIKPKNVSVYLFKFAFNSTSTGDGGNNNGNYYTSINGAEIDVCYWAFRVSGTDSYNTKIYDSRLTVNGFGDFGFAVRDFVVFGGAVEGRFGSATNVRSRSNISFIGTYFEAYNTAALARMFSLISGGMSLSFRSCHIYLNNIAEWVGVAAGSGYSAILIESMGNTFVLGPDSGDSATGHTVYSYNAAAPKLGNISGDRLYKDAANTRAVSYVTGSVPVGLYSNLTTL